MPVPTPHVWTDGGVIGRNPSKLGGTWAWVAVDPQTKERLDFAEGIVTPASVGLEAVTNNLTELYAAYKVLSALPADWGGLLFTDSQVTLRRLTDSDRFEGIPDALRRAIIKLRARRHWTPLLCCGHPTKSDLEVGYDGRGYPASRWNVFCDRRCGVLAKRFLAKRGGKDGASGERGPVAENGPGVGSNAGDEPPAGLPDPAEHLRLSDGEGKAGDQQAPGGAKEAG